MFTFTWTLTTSPMFAIFNLTASFCHSRGDLVKIHILAECLTIQQLKWANAL